MTYRHEIDGLRAIAVLLVLLFHFFPTLFPNGYLGVDLFFVISGYVITSQICHQLQSGTFTFRAFYSRRIKRILPLTFFALAVTVAAGYSILLPADFDRMMKSVLAVGTLWANLFFWLDGGYFGGADKLKPLLHMWSLSVEEQFYVFFPMVLWVLVVKLDLRGRTLMAALIALTLFSLSAYAFLHYIGGGTPAFFLMPSRAWQFFLGALASVATSSRMRRPSIPIAAFALTIMLAAVFVDPGRLPSNLILATAAAIYIAVTPRVSWLDRVLSSPVMTYLGLRSYSLYVWHWPIVAFLNYAYIDGTPVSARIAALSLSLALSEFSFRAIEKPFRYQLPISHSFALITTACMAMAGIAILSSSRSANTLMDHIAEQIQTNYRCGLNEFVPYGSSRACVLADLVDRNNIAILGNSHAQMYAGAIARHVKATHGGLILIPLNSCMPTVILNLSPRCLVQAQANLAAALADDSITTVIIGTTYSADRFVSASGANIDGPLPPEVSEALVDLVDKIEAARKHVILIGPILTPGYDLPSVLGRSLKFGRFTEADVRNALRAPRSSFDSLFSTTLITLEARLGNRLLRPDRILCDQHYCSFGDARGSYFADSNHLGRYGVEVVSPMLRDL